MKKQLWDIGEVYGKGFLKNYWEAVAYPQEARGKSPRFCLAMIKKCCKLYI